MWFSMNVFIWFATETNATAGEWSKSISGDAFYTSQRNDEWKNVWRSIGFDLMIILTRGFESWKALEIDSGKWTKLENQIWQDIFE